MSIFQPEYALPPPPLLPRRDRLRAILSKEIRARATGINIALLVLVYLSVVPIVVVEFYLTSRVGPFFSAAAPITLFFSPLAIGIWPFFLVLLATSVGAAIVAGDIATRSITMYLARPITPLDYLLAKLGAVGFWIALGAIGPGCLATIIVLSLGYVSLPVALLAGGGYLLVGVLDVLALAGLTVLLSSLASKSTFAGAGIFGTLIGAEAIASVLAAVAHQNDYLYASPFEDANAVARSLFGVTNNPIDPWAAAGLLAALGIVGALFAYWRLQRTEVVAE